MQMKAYMKLIRSYMGIMRLTAAVICLLLQLGASPLYGRRYDMAIIPNTDVNLASDIRDVLNAAGGSVTNDVITFFQERAKLNKWAKYKPFKYPKDFNVTDSERSSRNWGLSNVPYFDNVNYMADFVKYGSPQAGNCGTPYFTYIPPAGGASEPMRLEDFRGYFTDAVQPYMPYNGSVMMAESTYIFSITVPMNVQPSSQNYLTLADLHFINAYNNVVGDWKDCYLCMGLISMTSTEFYIATGNAEIADDPTIGKYPGTSVFVFNRMRYAAGKYKSFLFVSSVKDIGSSTAPTSGLFSPLTFTYGEVTLKDYAPPVELKEVTATKISTGTKVISVNFKIYNNTNDKLSASITVTILTQYEVTINNFNYTEYVNSDTYLSFGKSYLGSQVSNFDGAKKVNVTVIINGQTLSQTVDIQNY